MNLKKY